MERTQLSEEFFREARENPFLHVIQRMYTEAFAEGFSRALREIQDSVTDVDHSYGFQNLRDLSHSQLCAMGFTQLTSASRQAEAEYLVALSAIGPIVDWKGIL